MCRPRRRELRDIRSGHPSRRDLRLYRTSAACQGQAASRWLGFCSLKEMPAVRAGGRNNPLHLFRYILIESSFIHKYIEHNSSDLGTVFQFLRSIHNRKRNLDSQYSEICLSTKFASKCSVQTLFLVYIFQKSSHVPNGVESP